MPEPSFLPLQVIVVFGFPYSPSEISQYTIVTILFSLCPFALLAKVTLEGKSTDSRLPEFSLSD